MIKDLLSQIHVIYSKVKLAENSLNPKVSGYLPPAVYNLPAVVYDQLMAFQAKRGLESVELAVTVILSEYFGLQTPMATASDPTVSRVETLEAKCTSLSETVAELRVAIASIQGSSNSRPPSEIEPIAELPETDSLDCPAAPGTPDQENSEEPLSTPMTQAALARRLGVGTSSISRMQSKPNFPEWSQQKDPEGVAWVKSLDTKLFYPQTSQ